MKSSVFKPVRKKDFPLDAGLQKRLPSGPKSVEPGKKTDHFYIFAAP